jgi:hypothetical protein
LNCTPFSFAHSEEWDFSRLLLVSVLNSHRLSDITSINWSCDQLESDHTHFSSGRNHVLAAVQRCELDFLPASVIFILP